MTIHLFSFSCIYWCFDFFTEPFIYNVLFNFDYCTCSAHELAAATDEQHGNSRADSVPNAVTPQFSIILSIPIALGDLVLR